MTERRIGPNVKNDMNFYTKKYGMEDYHYFPLLGTERTYQWPADRTDHDKHRNADAGLGRGLYIGRKKTPHSPMSFGEKIGKGKRKRVKRGSKMMK
jgi:hypothetical protein